VILMRQLFIILKSHKRWISACLPIHFLSCTLALIGGQQWMLLTKILFYHNNTVIDCRCHCRWTVAAAMVCWSATWWCWGNWAAPGLLRMAGLSYVGEVSCAVEVLLWRCCCWWSKQKMQMRWRITGLNVVVCVAPRKAGNSTQHCPDVLNPHMHIDPE